MRPALIACFGPTIGLFLFAWTANPSIHWIASVIGITIYATTVYIVLQCVFGKFIFWLLDGKLLAEF